MRILEVVTLVTPLGEYGGPLRVAVNQAKALAAHGHSVTIAGAFIDDGPVPRDVDGVPARLFRARNIVPRSGHAGLVAPGLWRWVARYAHDFDVAHVHMARDLVTLPAALIAKLRGLRYVVQPHGMIDESDRLMSRPLDCIATRTALEGAESVLYLTTREHDDLRAVAGRRSLELVHLPNGVPTAEARTWIRDLGTEVLFLGRLTPRKRPLLFVAMAEVLSPDFPDARFTLVGPDDGEGSAVREAVDAAAARGVLITAQGAIPPSECIHRMKLAAVYVLPAIDEPYPMSVLEAMSVGLPVVVTNSCGLSGFVKSAAAGVVVEPTLGSLVDAVRGVLSDETGARAAGDRGRASVQAHRNMDSIVARLEHVYAR